MCITDTQGKHDDCQAIKKSFVLYMNMYIQQQPKEARRESRGGEMGEFSPPFFQSPLLSFFFLIPKILIGSITLLQKFTPHFKILDPRLEACGRL